MRPWEYRLPRVLRNFVFAFSLLAIGLSLQATAANAITLTFFGEDGSPGGTVPPAGNAATARQDFLDALAAGVSTEDFESFAFGSTAPLALSFTGGIGTIDATLTGAGDIDDGGAGRFPTSGSNLWDVTGSFSITFGTPVAAFGFFGTDVGDFEGSLTVQTSDGVTTTDYVVPHTIDVSSGALLFFGIIDTDNPFTSVVFGNTEAGVDIFGFDDLTVGDVSQVQVSAIPLPPAMLLFLSALGALGLIGRRRFRRRGARA